MDLDPPVAATRRLFPTVLSIEVTLAVDPEIDSARHLVLDIRVPLPDVPDFVSAVYQWTEEKYRLCPAALAETFRLVLTCRPMNPHDFLDVAGDVRPLN
jgi:hypothetical protein